jgi:hypothetical protein
MTACDTNTEEVAQLERLGNELRKLGFAATVCTHADRLPYLDVKNPRASVLGERVYAQGDFYYWSWAEVIASTDEVTQTAATLANVLRTVTGD